MTRLRAARHDAGMTLDEAARLAGITASYLAKCERSGGRSLSFRRALTLADLYKVRLNDLIGSRAARPTRQT